MARCCEGTHWLEVVVGKVARLAVCHERGTLKEPSLQDAPGHRRLHCTCYRELSGLPPLMPTSVSIAMLLAMQHLPCKASSRDCQMVGTTQEVAVSHCAGPS